MSGKNKEPETVAEGFLSALSAWKVDYLFANGGTDFPPIIEALARYRTAGIDAPQAVVVPHENLAMAMAHGHTMVSGRPQAVMVHVNVGTANTINGLLNASRANIPILLAAGRTPITEYGGPAGSRTRFIQWAQEMFDQGAMVREATKWDVELRTPGQVGSVVDRALSVATSTPMGPVYMSLPREVLAADLPAQGGISRPERHQVPTPAAPDEEAVKAIAGMLAAANKPLIITADSGRDPAAMDALGSFAERFAIPVVSHVPRSLGLRSDHQRHAGFEPGPLLAEAAVVIVLECDVPWIPNHVMPPEDCKVVHVGADPLFASYPLRDFPCDLAIATGSVTFLDALSPVLAALTNDMGPAIEERRRILTKDNNKLPPTADNSSAWIAHCLNEIKTDDTIVIGEMGLDPSNISFTRPQTFFSASPAGGLGWGLGAAIGAKLAAPDRPVVAVVGDGSYMFGNPTPAHLVAQTLDTPVLIIVANNGKWNAVERATRGMYPDGHATAANAMPLTQFDQSPAYEKISEAGGGYGEKVENSEDLPGALARAWKIVNEEGRQALVNVVST